MSGLKSRLRTLRRQSGATQPEPAASAAPPAAPSLSVGERLRRARPLGERPQSRLRTDPKELAGRLGAQLLDDGVLLLERRQHLDGLHGRFPLQRLREPLTHPDDGRPVSNEGLLFFDTETTGLSGGTGTVAFMVGMARIEREELAIRQVLLTGFGGEGAMLELCGRWLDSAQFLVSFNGKSFDAPLLSTRYRLQRRPDPLAGRPHIDLLHPVRRAFGSRWPDSRLQTAEQRLLGFSRINDLSGAEAPQAWFDFIHRGDARRLPGVVEHNRWDLVALAALLPVLEEVQRRPGELGADVLAMARAIQRRGDDRTALSLLNDNRAALDCDGLLELARLYRRAGKWQDCCAIWTPLAGSGNSEALEQLAKYYEHQRRDFASALSHTEAMLRQDDNPAHRHRAERLRGKLGRVKP